MTDNFPIILCVDDDPEVVERLTEHFALQGFIVLGATNGIEACLQVKRWAPAAVVLDLFIPRLGGIGTLERIRALDPGIPAIITSDTGDALELVREAGLSVTGALPKPLDLGRLSEMLARAGVTPPAELAAEPAQPRRRQARARVLVVDDEDEFREMLAEYLAGRGFDVREAAGGEEAVAQAAGLQPHIVLLDLSMEGMSGLEALRQIEGAAPEARIIVVTAIADLDTARAALSRGAADYVTKPFPFPYLDSVIEVHLPPGTATDPVSASIA
jgi:CheY-like chemotaxis protein